MYGRSTTANNQPAPSPRNVLNRAPQPSSSSRQGGSSGGLLPWLLVGAVVFYFGWALLEQHEKLKTAIQPKNIGVSIRNGAVILATVFIGVPLVKIGVAKYSAITNGRLGGHVLAQWVGAV